MKIKANQKKHKKSFRWSKLIIIAALALCVWRLGDRIDHYFDLQAEVDMYTIQLAQEQSIYNEKQEIISLMEKDAYLERLAREKLGMVKVGEVVVSAVESDLPVEQSDETDDDSQE